LPIAVAEGQVAFGIIRRLASVPSAKQKGIAIQFATLMELPGNTLTATFSAAKKMKKFDQFFRLIGILAEECSV
jgi:hypothetical protein